MFFSAVPFLFVVVLPYLKSLPSYDDVGVGLWTAVAGVCSAFLWYLAAEYVEHAAFNIGAAILSGVSIILSASSIKYPDFGSYTTLISKGFFSFCISFAAFLTLAAFMKIITLKPPKQPPVTH